MNLGTNAAQAMEKVGGILDISLWETVIGQESLKRYHGLRQGKYLVLTVKDTGHGMSKSIQSQIFDPFFSTRGVGKGTGMGLSVIHGIVTAHGGIIDVQSEVGKGSVFTVFIPARERMEDSSQNVMVAMPGGAETILFVDDEEEIVKMRTRMLEYLGYKVISATSGKQALTLIQEGGEQVDIVITDLTMPKMTGIQLAAEIRKIFTEIPVILCSGYSETVVPEEAEKAGVKKFMAKPLEMRALANAIREVINKQE
jgi:CheY-like chemotaxis protein